MEKHYKTFKLLFISAFSFFLYYYVGNHDALMLLQEKADKYFTHGGFEFFLFINIFKYFFLLLSFMSIIFLAFIPYKNKKNEY
ncbi:hypothetical protein TSEDIMI_30115 [Tenacibaculum sediminilitoris]